MATTYIRTAVAPFGAITIHRIVTTLWGVVATLRAWNDTRRTVAALRKLSANQLDDIGLTRGDIEEFAEAVCRKLGNRRVPDRPGDAIHRRHCGAPDCLHPRA